MKAKSARLSPSIQLQGGAATIANSPTPGWKGTAILSGWVNPRAPAVPATLHLTLDAYYAGCALIGILAAQTEQPNIDWASETAIEQGRNIAQKVRDQIPGQK
jgi:hypothetical protein